MLLWAKLGLIVALVLGAAWFARDYTLTKAENRELAARNEQSAEVTTMLGKAIETQRQRAEAYRQAYEELANVQDDNTCRSPAISRAFDILRRKRGSP
ncbi:hypothetical protein DL239_19845 [Sedimentitalea sp. CY04]|uniref:DUF2570 domain-containing protein n=1 Tax=Parasedimentitalea denitrificans TaxID=2211118 RepID=A0ABX0WEE6_9RHOB|nr:hypothetical protein [Sedimentitalea sp. CY04]NIZ63223.1 hypothetical protein [Sedimentitalea sp. CY04]